MGGTVVAAFEACDGRAVPAPRMWRPFIALAQERMHASGQAIPRIIFSMWHGTPPEFVAACLKRMAVQRGWTLIVGTPAQMITGLELDVPVDLATCEAAANSRYAYARLSDFVGASCVALHGGVWLDASTIVVRAPPPTPRASSRSALTSSWEV
jgi:hypothetical protein